MFGETLCLNQDDQGSKKETSSASTYESIKKVDMKSGQCPKPYEPCSKLTSAQNTVCVEPSQKPDACPITDVRIVYKHELEDFVASSEAKYE